MSEQVGERDDGRDDQADLYGGAQWDVDALRAEARDVFTTLVEVRQALDEMADPRTPPEELPGRIARLRAVVSRRTHAGSPDVDEAMLRYERDLVATMQQWVALTLGTWAVENRVALDLVPAAWRDGLYIEAILGILFGGGLVRPAAAEGPAGRPIGFEQVVPEHLRPDVRGAVVRFARVNSRVVRPGDR